jgi:hypothetical protein
MPDFFRIDCSVAPFNAKRVINGQEFIPVFDNPATPAVATGLVHIAKCTDAELALYAEVPCFDVTRLGPDEASAKEANDAINEDRTAAYAPKVKAAPVKTAADPDADQQRAPAKGKGKDKTPAAGEGSGEGS